MVTAKPKVQPQVRKLLAAIIAIQEVRAVTTDEPERRNLEDAQIALQHVVSALEGAGR